MSVSFGEVSQDAAAQLAGACPIVASDGRRDRSFKGRAQRLESTPDQLGIASDVKEYPGAGRSFLNRLTGRAAPLLKAAGFT